MDTSVLPSATDALKAYQGYQAPDSASVLGQAQQKYGVTDLASKVSSLRSLTGNLTNAIAAVDPSVTARTSGTLTTEGQRSALVSRERAPVVQQLGTANDSLNLASNDYSTADRNARSEADLTINDNKSKAEKLLQTYQLANERETRAATDRAAAEARARDQANNDREFSFKQEQAAQSNARDNAASARAGASSGKASAGDTKAAVQQHVTQALASNAGKDGFVSRATFGAALSDWQATGGTTRTFWQQYGRYANTKTKSQYPGYNQR